MGYACTAKTFGDTVVVPEGVGAPSAWILSTAKGPFTVPDPAGVVIKRTDLAEPFGSAVPFPHDDGRWHWLRGGATGVGVT